MEYYYLSQTTPLQGGMRIDNKDLTYIITLGDTGAKVKWDGIVTSQVNTTKQHITPAQRSVPENLNMHYIALF